MKKKHESSTAQELSGPLFQKQPLWIGLSFPQQRVGCSRWVSSPTGRQERRTDWYGDGENATRFSLKLENVTAGTKFVVIVLLTMKSHCPKFSNSALAVTIPTVVKGPAVVSRDFLKNNRTIYSSTVDFQGCKPSRLAGVLILVSCPSLLSINQHISKHYFYWFWKLDFVSLGCSQCRSLSTSVCMLILSARSHQILLVLKPDLCGGPRHQICFDVPCECIDACECIDVESGGGGVGYSCCIVLSFVFVVIKSNRI